VKIGYNIAMSLAQPIHSHYTVEQYLRLEREASDKHEYRDGEILAMAGGSPNHSLIIANVIREAGNQLKGKPCRVYESNLRIRIPRKTLYAYPDSSILCAPPQFDPDDRSGQTILNPRLLIEVLSPSTEAYDRGEKFNRYRELESLQEYVLISQDTPRIESFLRQEGGAWLFRTWNGPDAVAVFRSVDIELPLAEIYTGVEFPPEPEPTEEMTAF
jgi:Uma2 family endonuclease